MATGTQGVPTETASIGQTVDMTAPQNAYFPASATRGNQVLASNDRRSLSNVLLVGAVLATVGNALHPFIDPDATAEEFLAEAAASSSWVLLHLAIVVAIAALTVGIVVVARSFVGTPGELWGRAATVLAIIGGTVFAVQIGGLDGAVMPALADELAAGSDRAAVLATAGALQALDLALLALVVALYFGAMFVALGYGAQLAGVFSPWIRWTAMVAGSAGLVVGTMMYLGIADAVTFYAFRAIALATTVVAFGLAFHLRSAPAPQASGIAPAAG